MTKAWRHIVVYIVSILVIVFITDLKDGIVATTLWVRCNIESDGKTSDGCFDFYKKVSNDWWYINTALRRFDMETCRTCLCYRNLLSISTLPNLTERMIHDFDTKQWTGSKELAGAMILFYRTGDVRYLRRMFDVVFYPNDNERNERARRYYLSCALGWLHLSFPSDMEFPPGSSSDLPDVFLIQACEQWRADREGENE